MRRAKTITMRANTNLGTMLTSNCKRDGSHGEEPIQQQLDNLKAVIQSHAIPATCVQRFSAETIKNCIAVYNGIDHDGNGFATDTEVLKNYYELRAALGLTDAKCNLAKAAKKLTEMDFSGDGTLDLREFLHFATYVADSDEDELLKLSGTFATTTTAHGLGRVVNETSTARRM